MTEEEFRAKLDALGIRYTSLINSMNVMGAPALKEGYRRQAQGVLDEIAVLERFYRSQGSDANYAILVDEAVDLVTWGGQKFQRTSASTPEPVDPTIARFNYLIDRDAETKRQLEAHFDKDRQEEKAAWLRESKARHRRRNQARGIFVASAAFIVFWITYFVASFFY